MEFHSQMLSPNARRAMTAVTRGQNSSVNFGAQNYNADGTHKNIPLADRPFAKQKAALLPDEFVRLPGEDAVGVPTPTYEEVIESVEEGRATNPLAIAANPRDTIRSYRDRAPVPAGIRATRRVFARRSWLARTLRWR